MHPKLIEKIHEFVSEGIANTQDVVSLSNRRRGHSCLALLQQFTIYRRVYTQGGSPHAREPPLANIGWFGPQVSTRFSIVRSKSRDSRTLELRRSHEP